MAPTMRHRPLLHAVAILAFYALVFTVFFSPALLRGDLLADSGDGILLMPGPFFAPHRLWNPYLQSGFPAFADPSMPLVYPLTWLFSALGAWAAFMISAYVVGASATYAYVRAVTGSTVASLAAGLIYAMGGFMVVHLGHACIVHSLAWMPLMLWAVERLRQSPARSRVLVGSLAVAMCVLGGHPQFLLQAVALMAAYIAARAVRAPQGALRFVAGGLAMLLGGALLSAYLLVPALELMRLSARTAGSIEFFSSYSLPPRELVQLLFPFLFGPMIPEPYPGPYFGTWRLPETTGYAGLVSLMGLLLGVGLGRPRALAAFWTVVGLAALALAVLPATAAAPLLYQIPVYSLFRGQARSLSTVTLAVAVLAGMGIAALQQQAPRRRAAVRLAAAAVLVAVEGIGLFLWCVPDVMHAMQEVRGLGDRSFSPFENPAVGVPMLLAILGAAALLIFAGAPLRRSRGAILLACLTVDLASFGLFAPWRLSPPVQVLERSPSLARYAEEAALARSRVYVHGPPTPGSAPFSNLNQLWSIPSANGYTSWTLGRYDQVLALPWENPAVLRRGSAVLDLLSVQHVFVPRVPRAELEWGPNEQLLLNATAPAAQWHMPEPTRATRVAIVGALSDSAALPDHTPVAELRVVTAAGATLRHTLRAGDEFSEWAYERPDVRSRIAHRRAALMDSYPVVDQQQRLYIGHSYLAQIDLEGPVEVERIELEWTRPTGVLTVRGLTTWDAASRVSTPPHVSGFDLERWQPVEQMRRVTVYRNLSRLPRAWLTPQVRTLTAQQILAAITTSRLPDGTPFDPRRTALVETPLDWKDDSSAPGTVEITALGDNAIALATNAESPSFLVLSDIFYPGWRAAIDGRPVPIHPTDYLLRGVALPPGQHRVELVFRPVSLYVGIAISLSTAVLLSLWTARDRRRVDPAGRGAVVPRLHAPANGVT